MRVELVKAWGKCPIPGEDLALILRVHYGDFIKIMSGEKEPSEINKNLPAELFGEPVEKLFPTNGDIRPPRNHAVKKKGGAKK